MADESAELVGGISVSVGASHQKLISDLEQANRILDQWERQVRNVPVGAQFVAPAATQRQQQAPTVRFGATATTQAQAGQAQTALQRAINAELAKTGELYDSQTGEIVSQTRAVRQQRQVVTELQQQASKSVDLNFDTTALQAELDKVLATLREITAEAGKLAQAPAKASSGAGGRGSRPRAPRAASGDEEQEGNQGGRLQIQRPVVETATVPFAVNRSEAALNRQRQAEAARASRIAYSTPDIGALEEQDRRKEASRARAAEQYVSSQSNSQASRSAQRATAQVDQLFQNVANAFAAQYEDAADTATRAPAGTGAPAQQGARRVTPLTAEQIAARDRQRAEEAARTPPPGPRYTGPTSGRGISGATGVGGRSTAALQTDAEIERRNQVALARREAEQVTTQRTGRTLASGFGGLFLGGARDRTRAENDLTIATQKRLKAQRELSADEFHVRDLEARGLKGTREFTDATDQLAASREVLNKRTREEGDALQKVQSFSGLAAGARNLAAVTVAGAAFGVGLEAINIALKAGEKAAAPYFDQFSGYAQKTADLTSALADQARQQQGNAQAVVAVRLAQAGFSQSAAASIQPIIQQRVQIEAGNKALVEQIETFRIAENLRKQSATAGIGGGGTGGVLGTSLFGIPSTGEQIGNFLGGLTPTQTTTGRPNTSGRGRPTIAADSQQAIAQTQAFARGLDFVNSQLAKGGLSTARFAQAASSADSRVEQTAQAFDSLSPEMAKAIRANNLYADSIAGATDKFTAAVNALKSIDLAGTIIGPQEAIAAEQARQQQARNSVEALRQQFAYERPATLNRLDREQAFALNTQIPAQAALQNLANPPTPVGTGIVTRNKQEQASINAQLTEAGHLQDQLNSYYEQGYQILQNTYHIPAQILGDIQSIGSEISATQAKISNEQSAYQVAQFNFQLLIAKRTLSDINGLTGKNFGGAGQSYLGQLERENLALSRQGQLLQFNLSQRQINFQQAVAGFTVPGLTPAEQNARVEEAKIETSYAQKQLDIQKQMFGNQVKIVDISNLRQGADLARQIQLLLRGRQVSLDTAAAEQKLARLQARQAILVQQAGTYISKVNAQVSAAMSEIEAIEKATGHAISQAETQGIAAAYRVGQAFFQGIMGGGLLSGGNSGGGGGTGGPPKKLASGGAFNTLSPTRIGGGALVGEAGSETLLVLSHPRAAGGGGGGGGNVYVTFGDVTIRTEADFQRLYQMVVRALGRDAATKGLRAPF